MSLPFEILQERFQHIRPLRKLVGHEKTITGMAFSPDGKQFVSGGEDRTLRFWDVHTGRKLFKEEWGNKVECLSFAPNGKVLAVGCESGAIHIYNPILYRKERTFLELLELGSQCTEPAGMNKPGDVYRLVHYQDPGWLQPENMLEQILSHIPLLREKEGNLQVFWVISQHWDADTWQQNHSYYKKLRSLAQQKAWFVSIHQSHSKSKKNKPDCSSLFHEFHQVDNLLLWTSPQ